MDEKTLVLETISALVSIQCISNKINKMFNKYVRLYTYINEIYEVSVLAVHHSE